MLKNRFILSVLAACACSVTYAGITSGVDADGNPCVYIEGDLSQYQYYTGTGKDASVKGVIGGGQLSENCDSANMIVRGADTVINTLIGEGIQGTRVTGSKTITVEAGTIGTIIGGSDIRSSLKSINYKPKTDDEGNTTYKGGTKGATEWLPYYSTSDITINIKGGEVGEIRGGHNGGEALIGSEIAAAIQKDLELDPSGNTHTKLDELMADQSWAYGGNININISGGKVGGVYEDGVLQDAIRGAGGSRNSVDGSVNITISGDAEVIGDIYAGARSTTAEGGGLASKVVSEAYVKTTSITVEGGNVKGNVFGGGSFDAEDWNSDGVDLNSSKDEFSGKTGSTSVSITGGVVDGNVYGAGQYDTVTGSTSLELTGGTVIGDVYAGGKDSIIGTNNEGISTKIEISGTGTTVGGTIYGCSEDADNDAATGTLSGTRELTVSAGHDSTGNATGYKLADFTDIEVNGKVAIESLVTADEGTDVTVNNSAVVKTNAGVLTNLNDLTVNGLLDITVTEDTLDEDAVGGQKMTVGDQGVINVTNLTGDSNAEIKLFNFAQDIEGLDKLTLAVDGQIVSSDMWDAANGGITIKELSSATLGLSGNQSAFYGALKALAASGAADAMLSDLASSRDSATVKAQLDALSGHELATAMSSQVEGNMGHMRRLRAAIGNGPALDSYTSFALCSPAADGKGPEYVAPAAGGNRWRAGVQAYHEEGELDASDKGDGYDRSETGAMLTAEYFVNQGLTVGGALSRGRTSLKSDNARKRHEDNTRFDVFALYGKERWQFATALGLGLHQHDLKRTFTNAEADGYSVNFMQDVAYTLIAAEKSNVQAFATLASSWNHMDGYTEKGAYALRVDDQDSWTTDVTVGARYNHALPSLGSAPAGVFSVQTGVTGTLGDVDSETEMSLNGFRYSQKSASRDRIGWSVGASVDVPVRSNMSWYASAEAVMRGDYTSVDGQVGVKVAF